MTRMTGAATALLVATLAVVGLSAQPASATPGSGVRTALAHSAAGYLTPADRAALKTDPALGRTVVDPARTTTTSVASTPRRATAAETAGMSPATAASFWCRNVTATRIYRSTLGFTVYNFNNYVNWCYELNGTIHEIVARYWYLSKVDPTAQWQGLLGDVAYGEGTSRYVSQYQGHFQHCVIKYGCYGDSYPYVNLQVYSSGNYTYQTG